MGVTNDFKSPGHTALAGIEAMEDFYRAIGMPVSICELIGRQATDEEIKLMADKCSSGGSTTTGKLKVLHRDDMENIYRTVSGVTVGNFSLCQTYELSTYYASFCSGRFAELFT